MNSDLNQSQAEVTQYRNQSQEQTVHSRTNYNEVAYQPYQSFINFLEQFHEVILQNILPYDKKHSIEFSIA